MKRKNTIILSVILVFSLFTVGIPTVLAEKALPLVKDNLSSTEGFMNSIDINNKISNILKCSIAESDQEVLPVYIFLKCCDKSDVFSRLTEKYGYYTDGYEDKFKYYSDIVPNIKIDGNTISSFLNGESLSQEILSLNNEKSPLDSDLRKRINTAIVSDANEYLCSYRKEVSATIIRYLNDFIAENKSYLEDIIYKPEYGEFIIANVKKERIYEIALLKQVENIDLYEEINLTPDLWNAVSVTGSDSVSGIGSCNYNDGEGYDGTGIKVGIIEASGKFDPYDYNLSEADVTFIDTPGVATPAIHAHATAVTNLICAKKTTVNGHTYEGAAKNAKVYQTAAYSNLNFYNALTMFINMGVNVVNHSAGSHQWGGSYSSYDQSVDNIIANSRISVVNSAGNEGTVTDPGDINSPAKAYNVITVGNIETKSGTSNTELTPPYSLRYSSSTEEDSHLTNKPDVVAPGTHLYLPSSSSSEVLIHSGTSYSAPIVTAILAQIMQSDCYNLLHTNPAKNSIIMGASDDKLQLNNTTVSYNQLTNEYGAGLVNAKKSLSAANNFQKMYSGLFDSDDFAPTDYVTIASISLNRKQNFRAVLTYLKKENIALSSEYGNNIDIRLICSNSTSSFVMGAESTNNNVEVIDVQIPTTGTYLLQVRLANSILQNYENDELRYFVMWK